MCWINIFMVVWIFYCFYISYRVVYGVLKFHFHWSSRKTMLAADFFLLVKFDNILY